MNFFYTVEKKLFFFSQDFFELRRLDNGRFIDQHDRNAVVDAVPPPAGGVGTQKRVSGFNHGRLTQGTGEDF